VCAKGDDRLAIVNIKQELLLRCDDFSICLCVSLTVKNDILHVVYDRTFFSIARILRLPHFVDNNKLQPLIVCNYPSLLCLVHFTFYRPRSDTTGWLVGGFNVSGIKKQRTYISRRNSAESKRPSITFSLCLSVLLECWGNQTVYVKCANVCSNQPLFYCGGNFLESRRYAVAFREAFVRECHYAIYVQFYVTSKKMIRLQELIRFATGRGFTSTEVQ
jgi:hypothetical protein